MKSAIGFATALLLAGAAVAQPAAQPAARPAAGAAVHHQTVVKKTVVTTRHTVRHCHAEWRHHHRVRVCR